MLRLLLLSFFLKLIVTQGHCCHSNHDILQFWSDCNETMCVYMYVQLWFGILKMTTVSMVTMQIKNILFDLIVMQLHKNDPWYVQLCI